MHNGIMLLTQASGRDDAVKKVKEFLEPYGDGDVWDWYVCGGRWSGMLNPNNQAFEEKAKNIVPNKGGLGVTVRAAEESRPELQAAWESLGETTVNPWSRDQYDHDGLIDDVLPLSDCLSAVKDWRQDPIEAGKKAEEDAKQWLSPMNKRGDDYNMYGYALNRAAKLYQQDFSCECSVFNTESFDFTMPTDPEGWFAVMIDIHN